MIDWPPSSAPHRQNSNPINVGMHDLLQNGATGTVGSLFDTGEQVLSQHRQTAIPLSSNAVSSHLQHPKLAVRFLQEMRHQARSKAPVFGRENENEKRARRGQKTGYDVV